jgi:hypothetical protein
MIVEEEGPKTDKTDKTDKTAGTLQKKASFDGMKGALKTGWDRFKEFVTGKRIVQDKATGEIGIRKDQQIADGEEELNVEDWIESAEGGAVELEIVEEDEISIVEERSAGGNSMESDAYSFLDGLQDRKKDMELEKKKVDMRKRKREQETVNINTKGLTGTSGWEGREKEVKSDRRWVRSVIEEETGEEWEEKLPLPDTYKLGLDKRGMVMNSSARAKNNFGTNKEALFPKGGGQKGEKVNWTASFTRAGCIACRDEEDRLNHSGRTGAPIVLVIGDEAVPTVCGHTRKGDEEPSCTWVFQKEHLALQEVAGILGRINKDKQEHDRQQNRRPHEFFIPNGSKILVSSYVHLRKEGLEGYIADFNNMVKEVWKVTGDTGIEVLPVVPVVYEGIDEVGATLISALKDWIKWLAEQKGRNSIRALAETGGREYDTEMTATFVYKPSFNSMMGKGGNAKEWKNKGNVVSYVRGDRREVKVAGACPSREIDRLLDRDRVHEDILEESTEEERKRWSFEEGVSIDAEFTFTAAVEEFCRGAVSEGNFGGPYILNKKEQLRYREQKEQKGSGKQSVLLIGGSQVGRLGVVMHSVGGEAVCIEKHIRVKGYLSREEGVRISKEINEGKGMKVDKIVIGGPGNSLVKHGGAMDRGYGPERTVRVKKGKGAAGDSVTSAYHLTEPVRMTLCERSQVASVVCQIVRECRKAWPLAEIYYCGIYPRFVEKCCERKDHMSGEDPLVINNSRKELDREVENLLLRVGEDVKIVHWFETLGMSAEPQLREIVDKKVVSGDGVHLSVEANRSAAVYLCRRFLVGELEDFPEGKRRRLY